MADHLFRVDDSAGFCAQVTGAEVRRQLRLSVSLVVVLALGIVSAAVAVGSHPLDARRAVVSVPSATLHAESNVIRTKPI